MGSISHDPKLAKMEEVDGIIIHSLRSIGCDIEEDCSTIHQFSTELIVEAAATCLKVINNDTDITHRLPQSMSARFRVGTALATAVTNLGYRGEVGYQTFLYSNESEVRKVFMFLIEKLPRDSSEAVEESLGGSALLQRSVAATLARQLKSPWTPSYCKSHGIAWRGKPLTWHREGCSSVHNFKAYHLRSPRGVADITRKIPKECRNYYKRDLAPVTCQPPQHTAVAASILETNAVSFTAQQEWETEWDSEGLASRLSAEEYKARKRQKLQAGITDQLQRAVEAANTGDTPAQDPQDLVSMITAMSDRAAATTAKTKGSRFTHTEKLQFAQDEEKTVASLSIGKVEGGHIESQEEQQKKQEEEVESLRNEITEITSQLEKLELNMRKMNASKQQLTESLSSIEREKTEREDVRRVKKQTLDLLPDAEKNIEKLQAVVGASSQRLVNLANQWEKHRLPLIDQIRQLKEVNNNRVHEAENKLADIRELREKMKVTATEARTKEEMHKQLVSEYDRMTKDVNRSAYTRKIMEIVSNIKKQKEEIDKILVDTKSIQKEINMQAGKLDRTFTVTDELIFKDAKKDEAVRKAYKYLASLHENCNVLIKTVEETGAIVREIRDLEDQIEQESKKKVISNLERMTADYRQMKQENSSLMEKLKKQ